MPEERDIQKQNMLKEKIEILYRLLDCNNSKIARVLDCAPSEISRLRTGGRNYTPASRPVIRFAEGIYRYADGTGAIEPLCKLCGAKNDRHDEVVLALIAWLYGTEEIKLPSFMPLMEERLRNAKEQKKLSFGEKLGKAMEFLEMSNMRLARSVNLDASTISRFRNGVRSPKPPIDQLLALALFERAEKQRKLDELSRLCDSPEGLPSVDMLYGWLYDDAVAGVYSLDNLLDSIEQFSMRKQPDLPKPSEFMTEEIMHSEKSTYWGMDGLREAVLRFLAMAASKGGELCLYSDQSMMWMVGDEAYRAKWMALMVACIQAGVKIRIIYNIDRGTGEMLAGIQSWMPLYMFGMIEPYVCSLGRDARFAKTIFLHSDTACILGSLLRGTEEKGFYEYVMDEEKLRAISLEYDGLMAHSSPLLRIYVDDCQFFQEMDRRGTNIQSILPALSLGSMPEDMLRAMLERNGISSMQQEKIMVAHALKKEIFEQFLACGNVLEFLTLPSDEALFEGKVQAGFSSFFCDRELYYTPEEYASHIHAILSRMEENHGYELVILPEQPFSRLQIMATETSVAVIRSGKPYAAFVFSELRMVHSFEDYFSYLKKQYRMDRNTVKKKLMRFL